LLHDWDIVLNSCCSSSLNLLQQSRKWISSSTSPESHCPHNLWCGGMPWYLPVSICRRLNKQNLWKFIRSFRPYNPAFFSGTLLCYHVIYIYIYITIKYVNKTESLMFLNTIIKIQDSFFDQNHFYANLMITCL
jgi:hypothetical protein